MIVRVLQECGYSEALLGLSLSYNRLPEDMPRVANKLYCKDDSESKFLRQICVWIDITAPLYWWKQFDTYCVGVTKQSGSTMHTIMSRPLTLTDFEHPILIETLNSLNNLIEHKSFDELINDLPCGFLQRRIVCTNYQALRRSIKQRCRHKLPEWKLFITQVMEQLEHQEFIADLCKVLSL